MNREISSKETSGTIIVDHSHMGRRASGIERVTRELFSADTLAPLQSRATPAASGRLSMMFEQWIANPLRAAWRPRDIWIFSGYPPSPLFLFLTCPKVLYVHDLFLVTRWNDLNWPARLYMALPFRLALKRFSYFFVNSLTTGEHLASLVRPGAYIIPFRPASHNVFSLNFRKQTAPNSPDRPIIIGALGTIEPRKNFIAAAQIVEALRHRLNRKVELHIVGRSGWGMDYERLKNMPYVRLHGFVPDADMPEVVAAWDAFLCSSHDEGLGLPLLEIQHAGLPVIVPDQPIFHEVLGASGIYIRPGEPEEAAARIADILNAPRRLERCAELAKENIARWNRLAEEDRTNAITFLDDLRPGSAPNHRPDTIRHETME